MVAIVRVSKLYTARLYGQRELKNHMAADVADGVAGLSGSPLETLSSIL